MFSQKNADEGIAKENDVNDPYMKLEATGLNYIKNQRRYLLLSVIVPVFFIIIQLINILLTIYFIINTKQFIDPKRPTSTRWGILFIVDTITPIIVLLIFSFFALIHFFYLYKWNNNVKKYEHYSSAKDKDQIDEYVSLTKTFYDIIENMEQIKKIFIILNVVFIFYIQWFFRFFIIDIITIIARHGQILSPLRYIIPFLNLLVQIVLAVYIILNWRHFRHWNGKLTKIKALERQIYEELDDDNKNVLVIYGDQSELEEIRKILNERKESLIIKMVDKEKLNQKFNELLDYE